MARTKTKIAITIDTHVLRDVDKVAKAEGRTRSALIERCIRDSLGESLNLVKALTNPVLAEALGRAFGDPNVMREMFKVMGEKVSSNQIKTMNKAVDSVVEALQTDVGKGRK